MSKVWQKIRHNQSLVVSGILALAIVAWAYGCEPSVPSIVHQGQRLSRAELVAEVDTFAAQAASRFGSLAKQEQFRKTLFNLAIEYGKSGSVNPLAVAVTLGNILGLGAVIDNRRKDVKIKSQKSELEVLAETLNNATNSKDA